jgi:DNA-binding CsgD family transcriptional regulator
MSDELAGRATSWLQALWAQRAVDAFAEAGVLPPPANGARGRAPDAVAAAGPVGAGQRARPRALAMPGEDRSHPAARGSLPLGQANAIRARLARTSAGDALSEACEALGDVRSMALLRNERSNGLGAVLDNARHPILLTDGTRRCLDANTAATRLLGSSREDVVAHRLDHFVPERWRRALADRWATIERGATSSGAMLLVAAEGREVTAGFTAAVDLADDRHLIVIERIDGLRFSAWTATAATRRSGATLRPREREVLALVAAGRTSAGIALHLAVSRNTVESHIRNAVVRLGASNRTHAVVLALSRGEIALPDAEAPAEGASRAS